MAGRHPAPWQKKLLTLKNMKSKEISLTELQEITGKERKHINNTISKLVSRTKSETFFDTQEIYEAIKKKLSKGGE
jgi:hypothetical protein